MLKNGVKLFTAFDEYTIVNQIGQGGNGYVFKVHNYSGNLYALKALDRQKTPNDKLKRFRNELNFCYLHNHDNIINVHDFGAYCLDGINIVFYIMPLYEQTLRQRINSGINRDDALEILHYLLCGLQYAHEMGVVHRDIKPENILFRANDNIPVLADFGIAHFAKSDLLTTVETQDTERLANFQYAAPEQRKKGMSIDGRADIFALSLIMHEMFTGEIVSGSRYKKIAEIDPNYDYVDTLFEEMHSQDPNDRLFPAGRILQELRILSDKKKDSQKIKELQEQTFDCDIQARRFPVPKIRNVEYDNSVLHIYLEPKIPRGWFEIFGSGCYAHTSLLGYGPEYFHLDLASNTIVSVPINDASADEGTVSEILKLRLSIQTQHFVLRTSLQME